MTRTLQSRSCRSSAPAIVNRTLRICVALLAVCLALVAVGCRGHRQDVLRIGVTPGPAEELLHSVEPELARQGLRLQIVTFSDYVQPNMALASHDVDANLYQNVVFLNQFNRDHQTHFVPLAKIYLPLMAIYPGRTKSVAALGSGAHIAIPNDPVNHDRALLLLAKAGLLAIAQPDSPPVRIIGSPKQIQLVELDAAQLPRSLDDVDAAVINANFALDAGLNPSRGALLAETRDSPYANVLAVNRDAQTDTRFRTLTSALTSTQTRAFIETHYGGAIYPAE
jgi:D-methionine transport system substrate-binding protein